MRADDLDHKGALQRLPRPRKSDAHGRRAPDRLSDTIPVSSRATGLIGKRPIQKRGQRGVDFCKKNRNQVSALTVSPGSRLRRWNMMPTLPTIRLELQHRRLRSAWLTRNEGIRH